MATIDSTEKRIAEHRKVLRFWWTVGLLLVIVFVRDSSITGGEALGLVLWAFLQGAILGTYIARKWGLDP